MTIANPPAMNATTGATIAGIRTLPRIPSPRTAAAPTAANDEPTTPPISACDELDGNPKYQVIRFHEIAPISPANTTVGVIAPASTTSAATVAATSSEMTTATRGAIARVEIDVATTLAVS